MNDEKINRAIAEHLGAVWIYEDSSFASWPKQLQPMLARFNDYAGDCEVHKGMVFSRIPNFCGDLNAMHEAVQSLNEVELFRYADEVCDLAYDGHHDTDIQKMLKLPAEELAECFVRAIGKWRGEE
jgi:hypothetical protein